jgi:hypothetical protein
VLRPGRQDGPHSATRTIREDDVTEPDSPIEVPDADRAEQAELLDGPAVTAADVPAPPDDAPEADAIEQGLEAQPHEVGRRPEPIGDHEADDADVLEQETGVDLDEDDDSD